MEEQLSIDAYMIEEIKPKKDATVDSTSEQDIMKRMIKTQFLADLEATGINMEAVSNGRRYKNEEFHKFNLFIDGMSNDKNISLVDIVLFLEEAYFDMRTVLKCLNEENEYNLKYEASRQFNIKIKKSKLESIIE